MDNEVLVQNVEAICEQKGVKPTIACRESGAGKDFLTNIKKGQSPSLGKTKMLAEYLGVSTSELLGEPVVTPGSELEEYLEELRTRPEKRLLFHVTKGATKEQIEAIAKFIEGLENK